MASEAGEAASPANRRRSGRVTRKPEKFASAESSTNSTKRKRGNDKDSGIDADEPSSDEVQEDSSEEDIEQAQGRRGKRKTKAPTKKPALKKPKTNNDGVSLAIRSATAAKPLAKRPRKAAFRKSILPEETDGLYAEVFATKDRLEDVTANWITRFKEHKARALAEIVNLVLAAAGCDIRIDEDDTADPDNAPSRVAELQEEFQAHEVTEYPLIAKAKDGGGQAFKNALLGFFATLVQTVAQSGILYEDPELMENLSVWFGALSSTGNRPFRHTSTAASLAITTALADVAADIVESTAKRLRQSEAESKKSRVNKARVSAADQEVDEYNQKLEIVESALEDWFNIVYVHRYRDVDPRIRVDCVAALADWIIAYPDKFFDGSKLRYLGWVLSDPNAPTRVEVLQQLARLFRDEDKLAGLKTFTERFRPRMVEIATRDAENNVRAAAVDLLDVLREAGFLEPDDIDAVGKLIFDTDAKVRKSVVGFFAENVKAAYESIVEDMGGEEALNEAFAPSDETDKDFHNPRLEWMKLKCLVDQLLAYDEDDAQLPSQIESLSATGAELGLITAGVESRFSLAAQSLYDAIPEMQSWEVLAGYLLHDHSQTAETDVSDNVATLLQQNYKLEEKDETTLLGVLNAVVRLRLQRVADAPSDKKKTKGQRESDKEEQADMARRLSLLIPQLLKKYGALPEAAALCLRLERELNLDVFQELRQNAALTALLDDINKQFLTHHNHSVLTEAIGSIMHAQGNDEVKEAVTAKIQSLWDDLINTFDALRRGRDFSVRGNMDQNILGGVSNVVLKIAQLAKASDTSVLDYIVAPAKSKSRSKRAVLETPPITSVLEIIDRGVPGVDLDVDIEAAEDVLVRHAMSVLLIYFLWKCRECITHVEEGTSLADGDLIALVERRDACVTSLIRIMANRKGADEVRLEAANLLLDIYIMFHALKAKREKSPKTPNKTQGRAANDNSDDWKALCRNIDTETTKLIIQILTSSENSFAKLANKRLEEPDVDDDPIDPDEEEPDDDDELEEVENETGEYGVSDKQVRTILAEKALCDFGSRLVQAILISALNKDALSAVRKRLERNKTKLTPTWKEVVNHLDALKQKKGGKRAAPATKQAKTIKSKEIVEIQSDEEEEEEQEGQDEDEEMIDGDEEQVNGEDANGDEANGDAAEEESITGD